MRGTTLLASQMRNEHIRVNLLYIQKTGSRTTSFHLPAPFPPSRVLCQCIQKLLLPFTAVQVL